MEIAREQRVAELVLEAGPQELTVLDTSELTCDAAIEEFRSILKAPGATLPDGLEGGRAEPHVHERGRG